MMEVKMEVRRDRVVGPWAGAGTNSHIGSHRCGWRQHAQQPARSRGPAKFAVTVETNCVFAVKR